MRTIIIFFGLLALIAFSGCYAKRYFFNPKLRLKTAKSEIKKLADGNEIRDGDLIFQTSLSEQSKAIQLATKSRYSHCGIIYGENGRYYVFEAVQPVKPTPLDEWIVRGKDGHFVIKRLKNADEILTVETLEKMKREGEKFIGKDYDLTFEWSDEKIYCSELIWKIYQRAAGIEIGKLEKLSDFDLTSEVVRQKMKERYGDKIPMSETVISPAAIFDSELLMTVKSNAAPETECSAEKAAGLQSGRAVVSADDRDTDIVSLVEEVNNLFHQNKHDEAIALADDIDRRFGGSEDAETRERLATALGFKGLALDAKGYRGKAIETWEEADLRYAKDSASAMRATLSVLLHNKLDVLTRLSINGPYQQQEAEFAAAMEAFDEFERRYGNDKNPLIREMGAKAFYYKAVALGHRMRKDRPQDMTDPFFFAAYRNRESVAAIDELIGRYGDDGEPSVRAVAARALLAKGETFYQIGRRKEEIDAYDELDRRYGRDETPDVRAAVIEGLFNKARRFAQEANTSDRMEDDYAPAISIMNEIIERYGNDATPKVKEQVINVHFGKADALLYVKEPPVEKIAAIYDKIAQLCAEGETPAIRAKVVQALIGKGNLLADVQPREALAIFDEIDRLYADDQELVVREQAANALIEKGKLLIQLGKYSQARTVFEQAIQRYKGKEGVEMSRVASLAEFYLTGED